MKVAALLIALVAMVQADIYLHNPRGSNNRLDEANRERDNANRLFDSQNNNRGGYNVGSLYYYAGSFVPVEWTNQHSCADQNANCQIIFQYMCGELVRDGASTNTIPDNPLLCQNSNCTTDLKYGMHEPYSYYLDCKLRSRNKGLFIADRNLQGTSAIYTRQNEAGTRRGYECPEERDYYPYWHPTPWVDIAVLTNDVSQCSYYQSQSANVKSRYACVNYTTSTIPNNAADCVNIGRGVWKEFLPTPGLSAPECIDALWSRDNHLGNGVEFPGYPNYYNWTVPNTPAENCVFRVRYNISTGEYNGWNSSVNGNITRVTKSVLTNNIGAQATSATNPTVVQRNQAISSLDVSSYLGFGLNTSEQYRRGYVFRQNPTVMPFSEVPGFGLQLAINTNQFGRTFQDRSHTFAIKTVPDNLKGATIYNLNVRGKRGNIVQVYPGVEYDFVPDVLLASVNSYIHVQWTGSNTNPQDNAGQGQAGTDRSNIVLLRSPNYPEGNGRAGPSNGHWGNNYPAHLDSNQTLLGWSRVDRQALAVLDNLQRGGEMSELDDAGTYFDLGPRKVTQVGTYYYLCTRNNNFSNRDQKSKIIVQSNPYSNMRVGALGGSVTVSNNIISFTPAALTSPVIVEIVVFQNTSGAQAITNSANTPDNPVSQFTWVGPQQFSSSGGMATIQLELTEGSGLDVQVYRANEASGWVYQALDTTIANGMASAQTSSGGMFVAASSKTAIAAIATVLVVLVVLATIITVTLVVYFRVKKGAWGKFKTAVKSVPKLRRHVAGKV